MVYMPTYHLCFSCPAIGSMWIIHSFFLLFYVKKILHQSTNVLTQQLHLALSREKERNSNKINKRKQILKLEDEIWDCVQIGGCNEL